MEEENVFLEFLKNSLLNDQENKDDKTNKDKEKEKSNESKTIKKLSKLNSTESGFLSSSITKIQNRDDIDIMTEIIALCNQLSLSSD